MTAVNEHIYCLRCGGSGVVDLNANITSDCFNYVACPDCLGRGYTQFQASMMNLLSILLRSQQRAKVDHT